MSTISEQILGHDVGTYVEMYDILVGDDISGDPTDNLYYSTSIRVDSGTGATSPIIWKGNYYNHLPLEE